MLVRDMDDSTRRYTEFANAVASAKRGVLLKSEVVQTLHTTVFSLLMEEAGTLFRANEDATKLTDIARDVNHVLAHQNVSSGGDLRTDWRRGEAFTTVEKTYPGIRKAQRMTHSIHTLGTGLAGVLPAEHMHFMTDSAKQSRCRLTLVVTRW